MKIVLPKSYVQLKISWTLVIDADASISLDMILQNAGKIYTRNRHYREFHRVISTLVRKTSSFETDPD